MTARRNAGAAAQATHHQLSEQQIVDTALRLMRKVGAEKVSMRALAGELGVTPMAIYHHVPNKDALLDLVIDAVLSTVPMPTPNRQRWQAQMKAYAVVSWQAVSMYPDLSRILITRPNGKSGRALTRYGISILLTAGFDASEAALAIVTFHTYLYGAFGAISRQPAPGKRLRARRIASAGTRTGEGDIKDVTQHLREMRVEDTLDSGIDTVLAGIAARKRMKPQGRAPD